MLQLILKIQNTPSQTRLLRLTATSPDRLLGNCLLYPDLQAPGNSRYTLYGFRTYSPGHSCSQTYYMLHSRNTRYYRHNALQDTCHPDR